MFHNRVWEFMRGTGWRLPAILVLGGTLAACVPGPDDAGEYRQAVFSAMAWHFQTLGAMVGEDKEFDSETFERKADTVATLAKLPWEGFEEGGPEGSDAKAEIWDEWDDFREKADRLEEESAKLAEVAADEDREAIAEQFQATRSSCQDCHDRFRH